MFGVATARGLSSRGANAIARMKASAAITDSASPEVWFMAISRSGPGFCRVPAIEQAAYQSSPPGRFVTYPPPPMRAVTEFGSLRGVWT